MKNKKDKDMNAIVQKITTQAVDWQEMAAILKQEMPTLDDLNSDQLSAIAQKTIIESLTAEFQKQIKLSGINWQEKKDTFLNDTKSEQTRRAYGKAIARLEAWANRKSINLLELTAENADNFIRQLSAGELTEKTNRPSAATVRRDIAAISAFYSFLNRYHEQIKNPIKGTGLRPPKENLKEIITPSEKDYKTIIKELPPVERAIIVTLASRGLRAGALPTLELKDGKYRGRSKGKILKENNTAGVTLPPEAIKAIKAAGLDIKKPFAWETRQETKNSAHAIESRIFYFIDKLYSEGKIAARYSCHDFRHLFAKREYLKNKDIYRLSMLLNHAGIQITADYLKSLNIKL